VPRRKYRIALLVDDLKVDRWVRDLADWAIEHDRIDLTAVIVQAPARRTTIDRLLSLERTLLPGRSGPSHSIAELAVAEADKIDRLGLDAIVRCTSGVPERRLVEAASDGIISVVTRGEAPAFAEVLEGRPVTEFAIQRANGGGSEVLFRGSVATQLFYTDSRAALWDRAVPYLIRTIEQLARGEVQPHPAPSPGPVSKSPGTARALAYPARTAARVARKAWRHAVGREWNWGVAYIFAPWESADLRSGRILPKLPGTFVADPFVVENAGKHYIFVEEYPYSTRKGVISVFEVDETGAKRLGVALEEPYHLSFPFVFRKDGRFFMVPEGQGGGELVLYECEDFPLKWTRRKVLMREVCADTVVFEHGSSWWMLTTIKGRGRAENNAELHAFYADDPLGEWHPHRLNPIIMDASKGRNGGLLSDDEGRMYRVAQRAGFRTYGDAFAIYRIDELSPDSYRETLVREVHPDFFPKLAGTHHMHSQAGLTVYDFSRDERP
jgi:hypothetical protein